MASTFNTYFISVMNGNTEIPIPNKYISLGSYKSTPNQRQDLDSFRDSKGILHRNTLEHKVSKVEFNTPPLLEEELEDLQSKLNSGIINANERKLTIKHYCFDTHTYQISTVYMPDIDFTPLRLVKVGNTMKVLMDKVRLAFIEY